MGETVISFHLDTRSGIAPYLQIVGQVRQAVLLGLLAECSVAAVGHPDVLK